MNRQRGIAASLALSILGSAAFVAAYVAGGSRLGEGLGIALAATGLCGAALGWAFWILPHEIVTDTIAPNPSPALERRIGRPRMLLALAGTALAAFAAALMVPIRSLGPPHVDQLFHTRWRRGSRIAREDGTLVRADGLNVDSSIAIFPEDALGDAQSQATLIRLPHGMGRTQDGFIAFSRLCTHAGCPVALYRAATKELLCPCHQSLFDVVNDGAVISGPADHALPRLPIEIGDDGILRATGDFPEPVGPGFWQRG